MYSTAVASLIAPCYEVVDDETRRVRWRVLHVAMLALHRPMGAQANRVRVMRGPLPYRAVLNGVCEERKRSSTATHD